MRIEKYLYKNQYNTLYGYINKCMKIAIIIPSRLGSTRLANKAIADINGKTMIQRVIMQCKKSTICSQDDIILATDDAKIAQYAQQENIKYIITDSKIKTGTDRIYNALLQIDPSFTKYDFVVNVQGDVPNIDPAIIDDTINILQNIPQADIATAVCHCNQSDIVKTSVVKAVLSFKNNFVSQYNVKKTDIYDKIANAIYFSRNCVPHFVKSSQGNNIYEHIGIYAYRVSSLQKFVNLQSGELEECESLEQLRALENGMKIFASVAKSKPISIDTPEDLENARRIIY